MKALMTRVLHTRVNEKTAVTAYPASRDQTQRSGGMKEQTPVCSTLVTIFLWYVRAVSINSAVFPDC